MALQKILNAKLDLLTVQKDADGKVPMAEQLEVNRYMTLWLRMQARRAACAATLLRIVICGV